MLYARQSTAIIVTVGPVLDADGVAVTDGVVGDFLISKNGGAPAALNGSATLTHRNTGHYSLSLTATDVNTVGTVEIVINDTVNACAIKEIQVVETTTYDVLFADAAAGPASPTNITAGTITTATNVTTVNGLAANVITAAATAADFGTEVANAVWDTDATAHQTQGTFGQAIGDPVADTNTIFKAVVTDATGATVGVDAAAILADTGTDGVVVAAGSKTGYSLTATTGLGNQTADITGSLSGSVGSVTGAVGSVTGNVGGNVTGSVGSVAAGGITASSIATGAIDADALASDAVTEIRSTVSGTADSGTTTTMVDAARTEADTDYWKDSAILFTSGTISGQVRLITAFDTATDTITFTPATTQAVGTNTYEIIPNVAAAGASAPTAAEIADAVWDEDATAHQTQGTFGQAIGDPAADSDSIWALANTNLDAAISSRLATAGYTAPPSAATIADAVLDEDMTAHQAQGSLGQAIGDPVADADSIWGLVNTNLDAAVSSRMATYAQPTGFLAATFPAGTVANTTNITAGTVTTTTNVTTVNGLAANVITAASTAADFITEVQAGLSTVTTAQVNAEVDTALADIRLDELLAADSDIDGAAPPTVGSVFHELLTKTAGSFTYDQTTDSLEAIRDRGDAAWITATGFATQASVDVIDANVDSILVDTAEIGVAGAGLTNINLPNQTMDIVGNITGNVSGSVGSVTGAVGSVTGLTAANLDTTVSSRATPAQVNAEVVDALNVDTYAEPGQGTPAATLSIVAKINYLFKSWRNRKAQTSTAFSLYNDDATTVDQKSTVSDDGTTAERGEMATGP